MSSVPSLIENQLEKLEKHKLEPIELRYSEYLRFTIKEDNVVPVCITFRPIPSCTCKDYGLSLNNKNPPICYHIIFILMYYFKVNILSIKMYHKLAETFYGSLTGYVENWILEHNNIKNLKKYRKKKPYNFLKETEELTLFENNMCYLNPMYKYYTEEDCAICLEPLSKTQLMLCQECVNYSHIKCMSRWLHRKQGCHLCRDDPTKIKNENNDDFPELVKYDKLK